MDDKKNEKAARILEIYDKLLNGGAVSKAEMSQIYGVNERTIQRDIDDIRNFLSEKMIRSGDTARVEYDRSDKCFHLKTDSRSTLTVGQALAVCKVLLDSRAFSKKEIKDILNTLIDRCANKSGHKLLKETISNEMFHYVELQNVTKLDEVLQTLGEAVSDHRYIKLTYLRSFDKKTVERTIMPLAVLFSEYYFYLLAFISDGDAKKNFTVLNDPFPTIYRIDRIKGMRVLDEHFDIPYKDRFEEGEFRKRIQFMRGGKLRRVEFEYCGIDINAILDRLPTAKVVSENGGVYEVYAEVFGDGIEMWLRSQGDNVKNVRFS